MNCQYFHPEEQHGIPEGQGPKNQPDGHSLSRLWPCLRSWLPLLPLGSPGGVDHLHCCLSAFKYLIPMSGPCPPIRQLVQFRKEHSILVNSALWTHSLMREGNFVQRKRYPFLWVGTGLCRGTWPGQQNAGWHSTLIHPYASYLCSVHKPHNHMWQACLYAFLQPARLDLTCLPRAYPPTVILLFDLYWVSNAPPAGPHSISGIPCY